MAEKKGNRNQPFDEALSDLGLEGEFSRLVRLAVINGWTETEFLTHVSATRQFRRMFPGLIVDGQINPGLFANGNLLTAVSNYNALSEQFRQQGDLYGRPVGRRLIGALIRGDVAPEEFGRRLQVNDIVERNPQFRSFVDEQLKLAGRAPLDDMGFRKFIAGTGQREFYDIYEAAYLRQQGLNLDPTQAREVATAIGAVGELADVQSIVAAVRQYRTDIGPELARQNITEADLALLEAGSDPKNIAGTLQGILANRRAQGTFVAGTYAQQGAGGGIATLPTEGAPSAF